MRTILLILSVVALGCVSTSAQDVSEPVAEKPRLRLGDAPPPLQATKWLAGAEVTSFEQGRVYVVEFWATWCGPCVCMMPHLGDLQDELGSKGVTIIGFTSNDPGNSFEKVAEFVRKRAGKLGYSIAYTDDRQTYEAYMTAAGRGGIPCSFVIGADGKIAYIGHPLFLDEVLPKVIEGSWDPVKGTAELEAADDLWDATYAVMSQPGDPAAQLAEWEKFYARWPRLATDPYMNAARLRLLIAAERFPDAATLADAMVIKALQRNDTMCLAIVADALTAEQAIEQPDLAAAGLKAAEAAMAIDGETPAALVRLTKTYAATGDIAKVKEYGPKAVAAAEKALHGLSDAEDTLQIAAAHFQIAAAHLAAGDADKAKSAAEKAIRLADPENAGVRQYLEQQAKKYGVEPIQGEEKKD